MKYHDDSTVKLGDVVSVPVPSGSANARVVMLGDTYDHLDIDPSFLAWVLRDRVLKASSVVIEWVVTNPLAHNEPEYAPVGDYMFTVLDEHVVRIG